MRHVVIVGELNVDFILYNYQDFPAPGREVLVDDFRTALGGASAICAAGLARLGVPVRFIGRVGCDAWGDFCLEALRRAGVDVSGIRPDAALKTGVTVSIASTAERALVTFPGSIASLTLDHLADLDLGECGHLHISSYFLQAGLRPGCAALFRRASDAGWTTSLDPGCDPAGRWDGDWRETLQGVDLFLPNDVELAALTGTADPVDSLRRLANGRTLTVVKQGARGALALDGSRPIHAVPPRIEAIDTTGAGDSFNAGFLYAWLQARPLADCLRAAVTCGALSTRGVGGIATQPTREELEERLWEGRAALSARGIRCGPAG